MAEASMQRGPRAPRSKATATLLAVFFLAAFVCFVLLGNWQVQRRIWKLDLIERVEQRVHAAPVAAPGPQEWPGFAGSEQEYRHVLLSGVFQHDKEALVQASTVKGAGFWVLTPLVLADGSTVIVNRGFVPPEARSLAVHGSAAPRGMTVVTGLLRLSEPGGGFLRKNDPAADRWYSRDVQAIAAARGVTRVAPYFVDADGGDFAPPDAPIGGLTVVSFPNSHLSYALTWYGMALLTVVGAVIWWREELRLRRRQG